MQTVPAIPFALLAIAATATAQDWTRVFTPTPTPGYATRMAYHEDRDALVLFGGLEADDGIWPPPQPLAETWEYRNGAWTQRTTANVPPARSQHTMCYLPYQGLVVVFGGIDSQGSPLNDVWWFDGIDWQTQYYSTAPIARAGAAAYGDGNMIVIGGWSPVQGMLGDYWSWSPNFGWSQFPSAVPPRRDAAIGLTWTTQTYNGNPAERLFLYGGVDAQGTVLSDGFIVTVGSAVPANGLATAPPRSEHRLVYDAASRSTLLVGGRGPGGVLPAQGELWRFDGDRWTELATPTKPPATIGAAAAFDPDRRRLVLFGGALDGPASLLNPQHWEFEPGVVSEWFGSSCSAFPVSATLYGGLCERGADWQGSVSVPNNISWALFAFGLSNSSWNGVPLPFNLAPVGNAVCDLLVEPAVTQWQPTQPNGWAKTAAFSLPIPNVPSVYGIDVYAQALCGNGADILVTSQGVRSMVW
jgi:hypothetical protein